MIHDTKPPLDEALLVHFGIKGMKWGVRREVKREGKARAKEFMTNLQNHAKTNLLEISEAQYNKLSSKPVKLAEAGTTFSRISANKKGTLRDFAYVSTNEKDHNRYKALLIAGGGKEGFKKYSLDVKVSKAIVSPSKKERIDTFIETLDMDIKVKGLMGKEQTINGRKYLESFGNKSLDHLKALNNREYGLAMYNRFAQAQVINLPIHQVYASKLKAKGYNAMVDDADRGIFSDTPVILFPKESGASVTSIRRIDRHELWDARANLEMVKPQSD